MECLLTQPRFTSAIEIVPKSFAVLSKSS